MPKIVTTFIHPPIPIRSCDWQASYDGDEPNDEGQMRHGSGATEQAAIDELIDNYPPPCVDCDGKGSAFPGIECATCEGTGERCKDDKLDPITVQRLGV